MLQWKATGKTNTAHVIAAKRKRIKTENVSTEWQLYICTCNSLARTRSPLWTVWRVYCVLLLRSVEIMAIIKAIQRNLINYFYGRSPSRAHNQHTLRTRIKKDSENSVFRFYSVYGRRRSSPSAKQWRVIELWLCAAAVTLQDCRSAAARPKVLAVMHDGIDTVNGRLLLCTRQNGERVAVLFMPISPASFRPLANRSGAHSSAIEAPLFRLCVCVRLHPLLPSRTIVVV